MSSWAGGLRVAAPGSAALAGGVAAVPEFTVVPAVWLPGELRH